MTAGGPELLLPAARRAAGEVRAPGSKSISNRALLLAALAEGETRLRGLLDADDTRRMRAALARLGIAVEDLGDEQVVVRGAGGPPPSRRAELDLGNAGTALRPLTAVLALSGGSYRLSGTPRMHQRPIGDLVDALRRLGAAIDYLGEEGCPPLAISPAVGPLASQVTVAGTVSSQFVTALLLAAPLAGGPLRIEVTGELISRPYVEITLAMMERFGVVVERTGPGHDAFVVSAGARYRSPGVLEIEGDASSASYFLAAGALGGGPVRVRGVGRGSLQGDLAFAEALGRMGATITVGDDVVEAAGPPGRARLRALTLDCRDLPDAAMTLAVAALFADGASTLTGIGSWRVKETDRIAAMASELRKVGATVEHGDDWLRVTPPAAPTPGAAIATYDDHRMAMCFSLVCLGGVPVRILDPGCVDKTFPAYFARLGQLLIHSSP